MTFEEYEKRSMARITAKLMRPAVSPDETDQEKWIRERRERNDEIILRTLEERWRDPSIWGRVNDMGGTAAQYPSGVCTPELAARIERALQDAKVLKELKRKEKTLRSLQEAKAMGMKHRPTLQAKLKKMNPLEFERLCCLILEKKGYDAEVTKASGDFGADGILHCPRKGRGVMQAKRYEGEIGPAVVQQLIGTMAHYDAKFGIIMSTSTLTDAAWETLAAMDGNIEFISLAALTDMILSADLQDNL
jgi:HJR/Mrr/RecB family endonuclease